MGIGATEDGSIFELQDVRRIEDDGQPGQLEAHRLNLGRVARSKICSRVQELKSSPGTGGRLSLVGPSAKFSLVGQKGLTM